MRINFALPLFRHDSSASGPRRAARRGALYFGASSYPDYNQVNFLVPSGVAS